MGIFAVRFYEVLVTITPIKELYYVFYSVVCLDYTSTNFYVN